MDAVEFIKAIKRRAGTRPGYFGIDAATDPEALVQDMEQWVLKHPRKTRQSEFLKIFPRADVTDGLLFCPRPVDRAYICKCAGKVCADCRREFWMQEVE